MRYRKRFDLVTALGRKMTRAMGSTDFETPPAGEEKNGLHTFCVAAFFLLVLIIIAGQIAGAINPTH